MYLTNALTGEAIQTNNTIYKGTRPVNSLYFLKYINIKVQAINIHVYKPQLKNKPKKDD